MPHPSSSSPPNKKLTAAQAESLEALRSCLQCQLCDKRLNKPATVIACGHSFCRGCIVGHTDNSWDCPLPGCPQQPSNRGGAKKAVHQSFVLSAVLPCLENIERIVANAPDNWWESGQNNDDSAGEQKQKSSGGDNDEEVVDFQAIMDKENKKRKHEESTASSEDDDATEEFDIGEEIKAAKGQGAVGGRNTMSLGDQSSLFPSGTSVSQFNKNTPPEFSCSPIAMRSSQPDQSTGEDNDGRQTATASQLDRVLMPSAQKSDDVKSPTPLVAVVASNKVQLEGVSNNDNAPHKKQRTSSATTSKVAAPIQSSLAKGPSPKRAARVSFQQQPRVMLLNESWTLTNAHTRCLRKCANDGFISMLKMHNPGSEDDAFDNGDVFDSGFDFDTEEGRESFLAMLASNRTDNCPPAPLSFYAISTEKDEEFSFGDAIIVPRSFQFYLAVACGLPIVDIEFLSSAANMKRRGTTSHQRYPFPSLSGDSEKKRGRKNNQNDCLVLGASNYTWEAPKKAHTAALDRHSLWQKEEGPHAELETLFPGTDLLHDYNVLLLGEFDQPNHSKRTAAKRRKQRDSETKGGGYCTRGNISLLLQLCGAKVYDIESVTTAKHIKKGLTENQLDEIKNTKPLGGIGSSQTLNETLQSLTVMVKDKSEVKLANDFLNQLHPTERSQIHIVSCQWLLDSIGEFEVQDMGMVNISLSNER